MSACSCSGLDSDPERFDDLGRPIHKAMQVGHLIMSTCPPLTAFNVYLSLLTRAKTCVVSHTTHTELVIISFQNAPKTGCNLHR